MPKSLSRYSLNEIRQRKSLSNKQKLAATTDNDIAKQIAANPELYELTGQELAEFDLDTEDTFQPFSPK